MTLYMKHMFSDVRIAAGTAGIPAAFLVTAFEQLVAFALLLVWAAVSRLTQRRYVPVPLHTWRDGALVGLFALTLTANIALNNFSISLMPVSANLLIRSCFPLPTLGLQHLLARLAPAPGQLRTSACRTGELLMVLAGCLFAMLGVLAKHGAVQGARASEEADEFILGTVACVTSCLSGALNLVLVGAMQNRLGIGQLDIVLYTALPAAALLALPASLPHLTCWRGGTALTDWQVLREVARRRPAALWLPVGSGPLALLFNLLKFSVVQRLSPTHAALAGNCNKSAAVLLAVVLGLEQVPAGGWGAAMLCGCAGSVAAFAGFTLVRAAAPAEAAPDLKAELGPAKDPGGSRMSSPPSLASVSTMDPLGGDPCAACLLEEPPLSGA